jgi:hypothetical protein
LINLDNYSDKWIHPILLLNLSVFSKSLMSTQKMTITHSLALIYLLS